MKQQFVVTDTIPHSGITRQLGYKHTCWQNVVRSKMFSSYNFVKKVTFLSVGVLRIYQVFSISCKIV
jgi:hypothetical protein